ncbi:ubiquitin-like domain-containing protein CIP73 isoform X2 [Oryza brachyantha]|uniref:ubiquitin-like domain-containing protein CIP73 isoform X2 n=1 Tax=Oryza brachyantha TaxID=4533 RepID=UPI0007760B2B|nr:ubiquitin-like domain-containing protein CIP73 isoform X2 [Oryza brachyantha]
MESSSSDVHMSHCAEDSDNTESTIEIKIKTLDSQTYNLRVNKRVPVPLLKEKIATVTGILSEQQRLICRGRVLKDDELLSAYHVEDGHTLHLVVRQPGQSATSGNAVNEGTTSNPTRRRGPTMTRSIVLEAINVGQGSELSVAQLLQSLLRAPSSTQVSSGQAPSDARPSEGAQSSTQNSVRAVLDQLQVPPLFQSEAAQGLSEPNVIPDSLTTISQYINFLRDSFRREGFMDNGQTLNNPDHRTAGSDHGDGTQNQENQLDSASAHGLPTAALLAETMHSTRQLLVDHAGALLSQLPDQLGDIVNVTDATARRSLQNSVVRYGVLIQYLGSLLLELGRTTMMLRINPATSEAVVNSGPALFISPSGPNPLMVQPAPFVPGTGSVQMGPIFSSLTSHRSVLHPRDIDIHVRTSGSMSLTGTNPRELVEVHQTQERTDRSANASPANSSEAFAGVTGGTPFPVESGVRLVPGRTVVAVPAGINHLPSRSSSGAGAIYSWFTRIQRRAYTNAQPAHSANELPNPQSSPVESGVTGGTPFPVESGVRLVRLGPRRMVVAVLPAGISHLPSTSSSGVRVIYLRFSRIQRRAYTNAQPACSANELPNPQSSQYHEAGNLGSPVDTNGGNSTQTSPGEQNGQGPFSQLMDSFPWIGSLFPGENSRANGTSQQIPMPPAEQVDVRNHGAPEVPGVSDEGLRFASLVRQIMPFISQAEANHHSASAASSSTPQAAHGSLNAQRDGRSDSRNLHHHNRDPVDGPNSKRQRRSE